MLIFKISPIRMKSWLNWNTSSSSHTQGSTQRSVEHYDEIGDGAAAGMGWTVIGLLNQNQRESSNPGPVSGHAFPQ